MLAEHAERVGHRACRRRWQRVRVGLRVAVTGPLFEPCVDVAEFEMSWLPHTGAQAGPLEALAGVERLGPAPGSCGALVAPARPGQVRPVGRGRFVEILLVSGLQHSQEQRIPPRHLPLRRFKLTACAPSDKHQLLAQEIRKFLTLGS